MLQNPGAGDEERDVYDVMLTQADIQDIINEVNTTVKKEIAAAKCMPCNVVLRSNVCLVVCVCVCV